MEAAGKSAALFHIGDDRIELHRIGGVEQVESRSTPQQPHGLIHGFVFRRASHPGPDQELYWRALSWNTTSGLDARANFIQLRRDFAGPLGMLRGLPGEVENA